jgi:hypothetical protein
MGCRPAAALACATPGNVRTGQGRRARGGRNGPRSGAHASLEHGAGGAETGRGHGFAACAIEAGRDGPILPHERDQLAACVDHRDVLLDGGLRRHGRRDRALRVGEGPRQTFFVSLTRQSDLPAGRLAVVLDGLGQDIEERQRLLVGQVEPHASTLASKHLDPPDHEPGATDHHQQRGARQVGARRCAGEPSWIASTSRRVLSGAEPDRCLIGDERRKVGQRQHVAEQE